MRIGILGGTFNPIHLGHIRLAEEAFRKLKLDRLIWVPAYVPPHKMNKDIIPWQDRYAMVKLCIKDIPHYEISDIEERLKGTSYSINTIKEFKKVFGNTAQIFFIAGSDYVDELKTWKDIEKLKKICTFVIATRPGYKVFQAPKDTVAIEVDTPDVSSTDIRRAIRDNRPFRDLVPAEAYDYIIKKRLYR